MNIAVRPRRWCARGGEPFVRLGGTENEPAEPGEVVYCDEVGVICRRWNWREADRTKLTTETTHAIIVIEPPAIFPRTELEKAVAECAQMITTYLGGSASQHVLDARHSCIELP